MSDHFALELSELCFAVVGEDLRDRFFRARDDDVVAIDELPSEATRDERTHRAFSGGHESGEDQFGRNVTVAARNAARARLKIADLFEKSLEVAGNLEHRVAAKFFQECNAELER